MFYSLDHLLQPAMAKQKEEEMQAIQAIAIEAGSPETEIKRQRRHLLERLDLTYYEHKETLQRKYGLIGLEPPKTWKELEQRLADKEYRYSGKDENTEHYDALSHLIWWKKGQKEDKAGYNLSKKDLKKRYNSARDEIIVLPLERALDSLRSFETLH